MPDHQHDQDHDHSELSDIQLRVRALETILTEKGYVDPAALDLMVEAYETKIGPKTGAQIVARAVEPDVQRGRPVEPVEDGDPVALLEENRHEDAADVARTTRDENMHGPRRSTQRAEGRVSEYRRSLGLLPARRL